MYVPEGYGTVFPYMVVERAANFVEFLKSAFEAKEVGRTTGPSGEIRNSRIRIGTSTFMVTEAKAEGLKATTGYYYLYVEDADASMKKAVASGATKMFDPMDMPYGDRQGGVTDPEGNVWWISTRTVKEPYD